MIPAERVHPDIPNTYVRKAPKGADDCGELPVIVQKDGYRQTFISRWELSDKERRQVAEGGSIYLFVTSASHPMVGLATELVGEAGE
jgi:hypothetical protein